MEVKIKRDPYELRKYLYKNSTFELTPGLNVIIGRNGSGKTTFCMMIEEWCKDNKIPTYRYDNYVDGGNVKHQEYLFLGDMDALANTAFHSEGEQIFYNFGKQVEKIGSFVRKNITEKQLVVILDALDSGLDVEGLRQLKQIVDVITEDCKSRGTEIFFVITANNYGLIHKANCISVRDGKSYIFNDYNEYEKFILDQYKSDRAKKSRKN